MTDDKVEEQSEFLLLSYVMRSSGKQSEIKHGTLPVFYLIKVLIWRGILC